MNMWPLEKGWRDIDVASADDTLLHALRETFWNLELADARKLVSEFVDKDAKQAILGFRADAFNTVMTRLDELTV